MIRLENIELSYDRMLIRDSRLVIPDAQITLISGPSGSGKTALLYRIALMVNDCDVYFDDINPNKLNDDKVIDEIKRNRIGFVLQESLLPEHLTVEQTLLHYALIIDKQLSQDSIYDLLNEVRLDVPLNQNVSTLSLGQRQRLSLACVLVKDPEILVLDEPTSSLDEENENIIFEILKELTFKNKTIVISGHSEISYKYADRIYEIEDCRLVLKKEAIQPGAMIQKSDKNINKFFYKIYAIDYYKKYKARYILSSLVIFVIISLMTFGVYFINNIMNENKELLYNSFDKMLYITKDSNSFYVDNNFIYNEYPSFLPNEHPYIKVTLYEDDELFIIPYYDNQNFEYKLESVNKINTKRGIYISKEARKVLEKEYGYLSTNMTLNLNIHEKEDILLKSYNTQIIGFLKQGVRNYYNKNNDKFIYIYYKDIESLYSNASYIGFTAEFEDYQKLKEYRDIYESQGYNVNDCFIDMESIDSIVEFYSKIKLIYMITLFTVGTIILLFLKRNLLEIRKKELSILKLNGINSFIITKSLLYEFYLETRIPVIINLLFCSLLYFGLKSNIVIFFFSLLFLGVLFFGLLSLYLVFLKNMDIEAVLRDKKT